MSAELRSCGAAELRSCGAAELRCCGAAELRSCGATAAVGGKAWVCAVAKDTIYLSLCIAICFIK